MQSDFRGIGQSSLNDFQDDEFLLGDDDNQEKDQTKQEQQNSINNLTNNNNFNNFLAEQNNEESDLVKKQVKCYIFAWGKNESGELSFGATKQPFVNRPENPKNLDRVYISKISTSQNHSACISNTGDLYVCGSALHGKLGLEDLTMANINKFKLVPVFKGVKVLQVACGDYHTIALTDTDQVFSWGGTLHKKVGQRSGKPAPISHLNQKGVIMVDCGDYHSAAITKTGDLYTWGGGGQDYNKGQLGLGHAKDIENPEKNKFFEGKKVVKVSCGQFHTLALTSKNELYGWGAGEFGELGSGKVKHEYSPLKIKVNFNQYNILYENILYDKPNLNPEITDIKCGGHHSLILTNLGYVYSTGLGRQGQLGLRNADNQCEFQLVWTLTNKVVIQIAAGWNHSLVLTNENHVYACGYGAKGQLGLGDEESRTLFTHVTNLGGKNTATISAGGDHSWAVLDQNFPINDKYVPPTPLRPLEQRIQNKPQSRNTSPDVSMMRDASRSLPDDSKLVFERLLQVVFTEVDMCHRFVRFTLLDPSKPFKNRLNEYLEEMKEYENGGIVFTKFQNDETLYDENSNAINSTVNLSKNFTLMMICAVGQIRPDDIQYQGQGNPSMMTKATSIGDMTLLKESDVLKDPTQQKLGHWFLQFSKKFKGLVEKMKFFELRPSILQGQGSH